MLIWLFFLPAYSHAKSEDPTCFGRDFWLASRAVKEITANDIPGLEKKAEQGDVTIQILLSALYFDGKLIAKDAKRAAYWAKKAGNRAGPMELWALLADQVGDDPNQKVSEEEQFAIIKQGAEGGNVYLQWVWAELLKTVRGDGRAASIWYEKAAAQGCMDGHVKLAELYQDGVLGDKDIVRAYMHLNLVDYLHAFPGEVREDLQYDENRVRSWQANLRKEMTAAELKRAKQQAELWRKTHPR